MKKSIICLSVLVMLALCGCQEQAKTSTDDIAGLTNRVKMLEENAHFLFGKTRSHAGKINQIVKKTNKMLTAQTNLLHDVGYLNTEIDRLAAENETDSEQ